MFLKLRHIILMLLLPAVLGCSEYQKLSKGTDSEAKYAAAIDYYEDKDYFRALQLFEQLAPVYQGTIKAEKMQFYFTPPGTMGGIGEFSVCCPPSS